MLYFEWFKSILTNFDFLCAGSLIFSRSVKRWLSESLTHIHFGDHSHDRVRLLAGRTMIQPLSKEDETDAEVTWDDQNDINTFSKLHNKVADLQDLLADKNVALSLPSMTLRLLVCMMRV